MFRTILLALLFIAAPAAAKVDPKAAVEQLLAADRAYSDQAASAADPPTGLAPMFDADAVIPYPGKGLLVGRDAIIAAFRENPGFKEGKASWAPVRGGISADGTQGFTYGFLTTSSAVPAKPEHKYLAYWIRRPDGWRVVTYRQLVKDPGEASKDMIAPSLPNSGTEPVSDAAVIAAHNQSFAAAEKGFSDRAQTVGLKAAFREFGREDAMNMWGSPGFRTGLDAITEGFKDETGPAKIHWATERSFAASSGDLGVSIGTISPNDPKEGAGFPFFTVWRRGGPGEPWRYIAE